MGDVTSRDLADELRAVIELAATGDHAADDVADATALIGQAAALLDGPRRPRWYDLPDPADVDAITESYTALSPFRGTANALAPPMTIDQTVSDGAQVVEGRVYLGRRYEGPPNGVHGGVLAGLFDDILGAAQRLSGSRGVTARLTVRYRALTPIESDLVLRAEAGERSGRRVTCRATCHAGDTLTAEAEALFIGVDFERLGGGER